MKLLAYKQTKKKSNGGTISTDNNSIKIKVKDEFISFKLN